MQHICVFEDSRYSQLVPLVYTRSAFEIRCGLFTLLERTIRHYPNANIALFCRNYLSNILKERYPYRVNALYETEDSYLFLNGR
ncbi:MAG: putative sugar nucleotidyl transferase, partial [Planctomycetota bacterium]